MSARVLVCLPSWLGDIVQAEPAVRALAEAVGEERVSLAAPAQLLPVLEGRFPGARRLPHALDARERAAAWAGHGVALLFTNSFRTAWLAYRAGIQRRVGWARDGRRWLLTDSMCPALERGGAPLGIGRVGGGRRHLPRPFSADCAELVSLLGVVVRDTRPRLSASAEGRELCDRRLERFGLAPDASFMLVNLGSRTGSTKAYPSASWAAFLDALPEEENVLLLCGPGEEARLDELRLDEARSRSTRAVRAPVAGLPELLGLAERARCFVTADSGPRHLARGLGTRVVSIFGPTDPRHGADHLERDLEVREPVDCGPCHVEVCSQSGEREHACMHSISPLQLAELTGRLDAERG